MPDGRPGIGVVGRGRLGSRVLDACARQGRPVVLTASRTAGWRADGVPGVLVDVSGPEAHEEVREYCLRHRVALVECVSNLGPEQWAALEELSRQVPVVRATNLSVGHYAQSRMVEWLAALGVHTAFPAETSVLDQHPATKAHRPSATATALARLWTSAGGEVAEISSRRAGPPVSDHEVMWSWPSETLVLRHSVRDLDAAVSGALAAVRWARQARPGLVDMRVVYDDMVRTAKE